MKFRKRCVQYEQKIQRARNLLWFAEARYIEFPSAFIDQLQRDARLVPGETLPAPIVQADGGNITNAAQLLEHEEGFLTTPAVDPDGKSVIGFGHALKPEELASGTVSAGSTVIDIRDGITREQATLILQNDLAPAYAAIDQLVKVPLTSEQRDALASFIFSVGIHYFAQSSLLRVLNQGNYEAVPVQLRRWSLIRGLPILKARREAEVALWMLPPKDKTQQGAPSNNQNHKK